MRNRTRGPARMVSGIGIRMVLLVGLQDFVQVIEGLGSIEALLLKVILTQDETAVIEALVRQGGHIVALTVLQVQLIDIVLQTHFLYAALKLGVQSL